MRGGKAFVRFSYLDRADLPHLHTSPFAAATHLFSVLSPLPISAVPSPNIHPGKEGGEGENTDCFVLPKGSIVTSKGRKK